jgi:hypothetical protein
MNYQPCWHVKRSLQTVVIQWPSNRLARSATGSTETPFIPPWAVAVLRLQQIEHELRLREMGIKQETRAERPTDHRRQPAANERFTPKSGLITD